MRTVLAWLMMFGVFAGLTARAVPALQVHGHSHDHGHDHEGELWHPVAADDDHHDDHGPCDHDDDPPENSGDDESPGSSTDHHHHAFAVPSAIAVDPAADWRASELDCLLLGFQTLSLFPPEGPYLDSDGPPLI